MRISRTHGAAIGIEGELMQRKSTDDNIRIIESMLYKQSEIREAVRDVRAGHGGHTGGSPTGHAFISDTTAMEAIRHIEEVPLVNLDTGEKIHYPERWIKLFDSLAEWARGDFVKKGLLQRRYSGEDYRSTCADLSISPTTYFCNLQEIRNYSLAIACQLGVTRLI